MVFRGQAPCISGSVAAIAFLALGSLAAELSEFSRREYWDTSYRNGTYQEAYDWYFGWNGTSAEGDGGMLGLLKQAGVNTSSSILHIGCGNSKISEGLWHAGFYHVTHLDISDVVIQQMSSKLNFTNHTFVVGNITALGFDDAQFDAVLDKGALDAVFSAGKRMARRAIQEIARVLRPGSGRYVMVSYAEPSRRLTDLRFAHLPLRRRAAVGEPQTFSCDAINTNSKNHTRHAYICFPPLISLAGGPTTHTDL